MTNHRLRRCCAGSASGAKSDESKNSDDRRQREPKQYRVSLSERTAVGPGLEFEIRLVRPCCGAGRRRVKRWRARSQGQTRSALLRFRGRIETIVDYFYVAM